MIVRNPQRRAYLEDNGIVAKTRIPLSAGRQSARVRVTESLVDEFDLAIVAVQRPQIEALIPTLAKNRSRQIMFMFNCASGANNWIEQIGSERQLWGFPAVLADMHEQVLEYLIVPSALRFAQITTIGRADGALTGELATICNAFGGSGIPTVATDQMDAWLKTHVAYMAPIMAMGYVPARRRFGPRFTYAQAQQLASAIRTSFDILHANGVGITPANMRFLDRLTLPALTTLLWVVFFSPVAKRSLASHSGAAPREVEMLLAELETLGVAAGVPTDTVSQLAAGVPI